MPDKPISAAIGGLKKRVVPLTYRFVFIINQRQDYGIFNAMLFLKGILIGLLIAIPVGPVGILCVHRVIAKGRLAGLFSGLGAAAADGLYGAIAAFGLTLISDFLIGCSFWIRLFGGIFIVFIGARMYFTRPATDIEDDIPNTLGRDFLSTFIITVTNPMTIMGFLAIFAGFNLINSQRGFLDASILVAGVVAGSGIWWLALIIIFGFIRSKFEFSYLNAVNKIAGALIVLLGIASMIVQHNISPSQKNHALPAIEQAKDR
jgi:threonine/homoserine/homoserine lactone efflux protein